jgi:hypothetical protein
LAGFTGLRCEINIDDNLIGRYFCNCTEDFVGVDCENPRVVTCANEPCLNSANCTDLYDSLTLLANSYTVRLALMASTARIPSIIVPFSSLVVTTSFASLAFHSNP